MDTYKNRVRVAAHRGNSRYYPENTLLGFKEALKLNVDQLEIDLHMTKDGEIIMMHDHKVDRTTNGEGLIRDLTLAEIKALDAGSWKGEEFKGTQVPTFVEFLEMMKDYPDMTINVELKDYPTEGDDWAYISCDKSIALLEEYGWGDRIWINCWHAGLLEYVDKKYNHKYRLHGYFPFSVLKGEVTRPPYDYFHCACLWKKSPEEPVRDKEDFDLTISAGVEPWIYYSDDSEESWLKGCERGAMLITANDPAKCIAFLQKHGWHD